jgi:truncated hemoglobin YjbI
MKRPFLKFILAAGAAGAIGVLGAGCDDTTNTGGAGGATSTSGSSSTKATTASGSTSTGMAADCSKICDTYGMAVPTVAKQITEKAAADPEFKDFFASLVAKGQPAVDAFEVSLANFISDAYKCSTGKYTGPTMATAHAGMAITQKQYDDFVGLIAGILKMDGVKDEEISGCFAPTLTDPAFSSTIVGK